MKNFKRHFLASACVVLLLMNGSLIQAADHADAPLVSHDQATDIGDSYFFLDPNDNGRAILAMDVHGFITPGENGNMGFFDPDVNFRFQIENTGDAKGDTFIDISFSEQTSRSEPQTATINMFDKPRQGRGIQFTALTTVSSAASPNAPAPVLTTDLNSGITFFAGLRDDPFFFDIPGFVRFLASVRAGSPNVGVLSRGRDSFAGYNINMIVLSVPVSLLQGIIEERLLSAYRRIRSNARNGLAVVAFERGSCGGCFNAIPPQRQLDIRSHKKIIVCEHCGRILVDEYVVERVKGEN